MLMISDANVLIDLEEGDLIEQFFKLPYNIYCPDTLFYEELGEHHHSLLDLGLQLMVLDGSTVLQANRLILQYSKVSNNDCFALALAQLKNCPLLSGDLALRKAADAESVEVYGTIWIVKCLIQLKIINLHQAEIALIRMKDSKRRLPWKDFAEMLDKFRKTGEH